MNPVCDLETETAYEEKCSVLSDTEGPFKDCINKMPAGVIWNSTCGGEIWLL